MLIIDGKKLGISIILLGLMLIMFGISAQISGGLRYVALIQNDMTSLKTYYAIDNKLSYKMPSDWKNETEKFEVGEILYHSNFYSKDGKISGSVEVFGNTQDMDGFVKRNKEIFEKNNILKNYNIKKVKINNKEAYFITYELKNKDDINHKCTEYYIRYNDGFIRDSFFVIDSNFKENMPTIFRAIVETFKY
ncbi:MAG: PsbP-related protein [Bacillota bacterium]|nr:PsbP-related protein [Bacillota bacterium]